MIRLKLAACLVLVSLGSLHAQTWNAPNTGFTGDAANWTPNIPANSVDSVWTFGGNPGDSYGALNNFAAGYLLNGITLNSTSANATIFAPGAALPTAINPSLSSTSVVPFINTSAVGPVFFATPLTLAHTSFEFSGAGSNNLYFNGTLSGAARTITKTGDYRLTLQQNNDTTLTGATVWNINGGTVDIQNSISKLGPTTVTVNFNGGTLSTVTSGGSASASRSFALQSGINTWDVQVLGTNFAVSTSALTGSAATTFRKTGPGVVTLSSSYPAFNSSINVVEGSLLIGSDGGTGTGATINVSSGATYGTSSTGTLALLPANNRNVNLAGVGFQDLTSVLNNSVGTGAFAALGAAGIHNFPNTLTITGSTAIAGTAASTTLTASIAESTPGSSLIKDGSVTVILTSPTAYSGTTTIRTGILSLATNNGAIPASAGITIGYLATTTANLSGTLQLDNSVANNADRVGNSIPLNLRSGLITQVANSAITATETLGTVTFESGTGSITATPQTGAGAQLTITTIARTNRATAIFRGTALGSAPANNVSNIFVNGGFGASDFSGTAGSSGFDREVLRWGAGTTATGTVVNNFLTRDTNGLRFLTAGEINTTATIAAANNGQNIRNTTSGNVTGDAAVNALDMAGLTLNMASNTFLRINSGLLINQTTTVSLNSQFNAAVVDFGTIEPIFAGQALINSAYIVSKNGLTRAAGGTTASSVILNQPNVIDGTITLNGVGNAGGGGQGIIIVNNLSSLGNPTNPINFAGGRLIIQAAPGGTLAQNITIFEGGGDLNFGAGATDPGPVFVHTGTLSGSGRLTKSGAGTLVLNGDNSGTFAGQTQFTSGIVSINSDKALGSNGELLFNGGRLIVTGNANFGTTRTVAFNAASSFGVESGATLTLQGSIVGSSAITRTGSGDLALEGNSTSTSTMTLTGTPALRQAMTTGGTTYIRGANGRWGGTSILVSSGTSLALDNATANNNDRIRSDGAITMQGGTLRLIGNASAPTHELMGALTLGGASAALDWTLSRITFEPAAGQQFILAPSSIVRTTSRAQLLLTGPIPTGASPSGWLGANISNLIPLTAPTLAGGGGSGSLTSILPGAMGNTSSGGSGQGFLTYNPVAGLRLLDPTEYDATFTSGSTALVNVKLAATAISGINAATTINALILDNGSSVAGTGTLTVNSGTIATLRVPANSITTTALAFPATTTGNIFANSDLNITSNITTTTLGLHKSGAGKLTLSGTNSFTGGLAVSGGTLSVATDASLGGSGSNVILDGGTLEITGSGFVSTRTIIVLANGGVIDTGANSVSWGVTGVPGVGNTTATTAVGPVAKTGTGTLTHGSMSTTSYAGGMNILQGTIVFSASTSNISDASPIVISANASLQFNGTTADTVGSIAGAGNLLVGGGTAFALTVGSTTSITPDVTFAGTITGAATSSIVKAAQGEWTINPGTTLSSYPGTWAVTGGKLILGGDALVSTDGVLGNASSAITIGANTTTSDPASLLTNGPFTVARPLTLVTVVAATNMAQPITIGTIATTGTTTFSGTITYGNAASANAKILQVTAAGTSIVDITGQIVIGGGFTGVATIEKIGDGTLQLSNATSTYTGRTVLTRGTLAFGADGTATAGPIGASTLVLNGGTVAAAGANRSLDSPVIVNNDVTFGGANNLTFNGTAPFMLGLGTRVLTVTAPTVTINAVIRGSSGFTGFGGLTKSGPGTLVLTGANTYSGGTTVSSGVLAVNNTTGSGTGPASSSVLVSGGTLRGTGTAAGPITLASGTLAPGDAANVGALTTNTQPVFSGGTFSVSLTALGAGNYGQLVLSGAAGNLDLGSGNPTTLFLGTTYSGALDGSFEIISNPSGTGVTNRFSNFTEGQVVFTNLGTGNDYRIFYGTHPDFPGSVVLAVPEPSVLLGLAGLTVLLRRRHRGNP